MIKMLCENSYLEESGCGEGSHPVPNSNLLQRHEPSWDIVFQDICRLLTQRIMNLFFLFLKNNFSYYEKINTHVLLSTALYVIGSCCEI